MTPHAEAQAARARSRPAPTLVGGCGSGRKPVVDEPLGEATGAAAIDVGGRLDPRDLCDLLFAAPTRFRANLATLEPGTDACQLELKRGTATLVRTRVDAEVAVAAALCIAKIAGIDPLRLSTEVDAKGIARRVTVRLAAVATEVLVCLTALSTGLRVEIRPLQTESDAPPDSAPSSLRRCVQCGLLQSGARARCEVDQGNLFEVVERAEVGGFLGNYHLERLIGEGGMGRVFLARHGFLRTAAAIKLLHRTMTEDPLSGQRFLAEARVARSIRHENIVQVIDYGLMLDGRPFMVMELVDGTSLDDLLAREHSLPPLQALQIAREVALGLAAAHQRGAVHLDLKPANVMLTHATDTVHSRVKLIDFGASVQVGAVGEEGTPAYMSPEHACGEPIDVRSDLYSLGVVLFEMLGGCLPFEGDDAASILRAHVTQPAPIATSPHRALPRAVTELVARLLEKAPKDRFSSATAFVEQADAAIAVLQRKEWLRWLP
jgi:hypothetical protein